MTGSHNASVPLAEKIKSLIMQGAFETGEQLNEHALTVLGQ